MKDLFMTKAVKSALKSENDIPVGAVIVKNGKIIASACNKREKNNDISAHAEIIAIKKAGKVLNNWRLDECELYVTLEPCPMCAWAILQSRLKSVYFGSYDLQYGALGSKLNLSQLSSSKLHVKGGFMEEECDKILRDFFKRIRNDNKR